MTTPEFLRILENQNLVPADVAAKLRKKAAQDGDRITPKAVLKYLVKKEYIPRDVAYQLLKTTLTVSAKAESSILGFVPLSEPPTEGSLSSKSVTEEDDEDVPTLKPMDSRQNLRMDEIEASSAASSNIFDEGPPPIEKASPEPSTLASLSASNKVQEESEKLFDEVVNRPPARQVRAKAKSKRRQKKSEWDSSLIIYGGGGLLVLLITGGVIYTLLTRENADVVLEQASDYFNGGSYTQAITQYEHFVDTFSGDPHYSLAKVRLGMARLWKDTSNTSDYAGALATAQQVLDDIQDEPEFSSAHRDLASLLPKIAQGLATQAEEADDAALTEKRVDQTRQALSLYMNTKFVPKEFRDEVVLEEVEQALLRVERNRQQQIDLEKTLADIDAAIAAQDIASAYDLRGALLEKHPALVREEALTAKVQEISAAEASAVEYLDESLSPTTSPRETSVVASLTLGENHAALPTEAAGTVAVRVGGAIYGLRAEDGGLLWREYLGVDPRSTPIALADGDFLLSDQVHQELVRIVGATGKVKWRLALADDVLQPVVARGSAYVAGTSGKLHVVNLETGQRTGYWKFGQKLAVPPTVDSKNDLLYVPGEHSSLYTLSLTDKSCLNVFYLGHSAGAISVPLVKVLDKLIVAVNTGVTTSELRVLSTSGKGTAQSVDTERRLEGTVDTQLLTTGRRLVALTDRGQVAAFDVAAAKGDRALSEIAQHDPDDGPAVARFGTLQNANVWVAGRKLLKLEIQATANRMRVRDLENDFFGDVFDHPLIQTGNLVIHVRRPSRQAGAVVAATVATNGKVAWETELGVPLAGPPAVDAAAGRVTVMTATGAAFALDHQALSRRVQDHSDRLMRSRRSLPVFQTTVDLGQGRIAAGETRADLVLHYRPDAPRGPVTAVQLASPLASELISWRDGFVAPTEVGQVYYFAAEDGQQRGTPFQPPLVPGQEFVWQTPAVFRDGERELLVLTDGNTKIYLLESRSEPRPHLEAVAEEKLGDVPLQTRLAVSGHTLVAGTLGGAVARFELPNLHAVDPTQVGGTITWGPFACGDAFLLATDADELVCLGSEGQLAWKIPLESKAPTGKPLAENGDLLLAWQLQGISRIALSDGEVLENVPLEQALASGPVLFANRLLVAAADGTLLVVNRP